MQKNRKVRVKGRWVWGKACRRNKRWDGVKEMVEGFFQFQSLDFNGEKHARGEQKGESKRRWV